MVRRKKPSPEQKQKTDYEQLGRMLANIYESGYVNHNQTYKMSFIKGMLGGLGGAVGATLLVALLVSILQIFSDFGPIDWIRDTLQR